MATVMRSIGRHVQLVWYPFILIVPAALQWAAFQLSTGFAQVVSYGMVLAAATLATGYSAHLAYRSRYAREFVAPVALGLGLWTTGLLAALLQVSIWHTSPAGMPSGPLLLSYGLPFLFAAATYADPYSTRVQKILDALLLLFLGLLSAVSLQDVATSNLQMAGSGMRLGDELHIENALLCVAHVFRWLTSDSLEARRRFRTSSVFLLTFTAGVWLNSHFNAPEAPGLLIYLSQSLMPVPFLLLTLMLFQQRNIASVSDTRSSLSKVLVLGVAPALFLAGIFAFSISIYAHHSSLGLGVAGLAMVVYVLRSLLTQYSQVTTQGRLQDLAARLERISYTDAVTEIPNRRSFQEAYARAWGVVDRDQHSMSVLMIDVDRFKDFNDLYGHQAGDECLRNVAHIVSGTLSRISDFCGRYGGEEFVVFLAGTALEGATVVAERIRHGVYEAALTHARGVDGRVTVSVGIASHEDSDTDSASLLKRADANLYRAKALGRNRTCAELTADVASGGGVPIGDSQIVRRLDPQ